MGSENRDLVETTRGHFSDAELGWCDPQSSTAMAGTHSHASPVRGTMGHDGGRCLAGSAVPEARLL